MLHLTYVCQTYPKIWEHCKTLQEQKYQMNQIKSNSNEIDQNRPSRLATKCASGIQRNSNILGNKYVLKIIKNMVSLILIIDHTGIYMIIQNDAYLDVKVLTNETELKSFEITWNHTHSNTFKHACSTASAATPTQGPAHCPSRVSMYFNAFVTTRTYSILFIAWELFHQSRKQNDVKLYKTQGPKHTKTIQRNSKQYITIQLLQRVWVDDNVWFKSVLQSI